MRTIPSFAALALALAFAPAARAAEPRLGYVDLQRALSEVEEGKAAKAILDKESETRQQQLNAKQDELKALQADYDKQQMVLSDQAKKEKTADFNKRMGELQDLYMKLQQELSRRQQEVLGPIADRVKAVMIDIAEGEGLQMVIDRAAVAWAPASLDITNEVIRKYNAKFPAKGGVPAAKTEAKPKPTTPPAGGKK
jgi:outer membrane protein